MLRFTRIRWRALGLGLLSLVCVVLFAACGGSAPTADSGSPSTADTAPLKVALDPTFPPFQSQTGAGQFEGFDIDLMNAVAEAGGFTMNMEGLPFDGIIPALQAGTIDATISTMTITKERAEVVDFSRPYFKAGLAIAVQDSNTDITGFDALGGKKISAQIGTTGEAEARKSGASEVRTFDSTPIALQELSNGNVDATISDAPAILYAIKSGGVRGVKVVGELLTEEFYGIATPKGSPNLEKINAGLQTIIANGKYKEIYQKWFDGEPPVLPEAAPI
ncbi:basic amino acid ABC transporter substrate-binding protein [Thermoleptolyngbya sp. C42_A2020_037]|uniref:basic amino acid ABC transporter substrate-binding protein n=1 Tax=Thermoleptolyngbya sp. C42_A2020_037 TaxID=2747799 RepID=UPI0019FBE2CE|nr:basic amino acid ABC transporter substrate-binding protein [Thermoleptolyngbya sp. C42_A2020_037]MBF2086721.1 basic amino acid ABC transporter substrate-binding protein [Thermoleptolyngbya sp. C42_A2020_037]